MEKSESLNLTNEQLQVLVSGKFGDGCIKTPRTYVNSYFTANCIHEEYIDYKINLLGKLISNVNYTEKNGYSKTPIYSFYTHTDSNIKQA